MSNESNLPMTEHKAPELMIACEECGLVVDMPKLKEGQKAGCPRCHHTLTKQILMPFQRPLAYGIACMIMLVLSISFPFMSFSVQGISQEITLLHAAEMLQHFENSLLAFLLLMTVIVLPAGYISVVMYLYYTASKLQRVGHDNVNLRVIKRLCRGIFRVEAWLMVDVFFIGVLVSLIKIASLADVGLGISFGAFCVYTVLVVKCVSMVDRTWLWGQFIPMEPLSDVKLGDTHMSNNHVNCHMCSQLNPMPEKAHTKCLRCDSQLHQYAPNLSLQKSWALLLASFIFYIPANLYPMMYTVSLGKEEGSTIMGGVFLLWNMGSYPIALVIFLASVVIPLAKMFSLVWLFISARKTADSSTKRAIQHLGLYRMTELIGRWSMIDIFVVAILVALVQLQNLMAIFPGPAALSFAIVVICTMLSAMQFDPRVFWSLSSGSDELSPHLDEIKEFDTAEPSVQSTVISNFNKKPDYE